MNEKREREEVRERRPDSDTRAPERDDAHASPERDRHPAPGITHEPEPDAENLIPVDDEPGTL